MAPPGGSRVAKNVVAGTLGRIFIVLLGLVVTSTLLANLGPTQFGLFTILTSFQAYFGVLDLGIGGGLVRFMTIYSERDEARVVRAITSFGFAFYLVLALVLLPGVFFAAPAVAAWLGVDASLTPTTIHAVYAVYGLFIVSSMSGVITARVYSIHRMDIVAMADAASGLTYAVAALVFLPLYPTIGTALICLYLQVFMLMGLMVFYLLRLTPGLLLSNPFLTPKGLIRELFHFGFWTQINSVSAIVNLEAGKLIIGRYLGVAEVAPYQVGGRLAMVTRALPIQILTAMLPSLAAHFARGSTPEQTSDIYRSATRTLMLVTLVTVGFPAAVSSSLIGAWIGHDIPAAASIAVALMVSYSVNNLTGVGTLMLRARGMPKYETIYAVCSASLSIVSTILLLPRFGIYGVVYGTICGNVIGSVGFIFFFHRTLKIDFAKTVLPWLGPLIVSVAAAAALVSGLEAVAMPPGAGRLSTLLLLGVLGVVYLIVVAELLRLLRFWTPQDFALLNRFGVAGRWLGQRYT